MTQSRWAVRARRRLFVGIGIFFVVLAVPLGFLILRLYEQLRVENFFRYRSGAEAVVLQINQQLQEMLLPEEGRPFDEYSFFSVSTNPLDPQQRIGFSPLSRYPIQSPVPGLIGYFQLDPSRQLTSPLLPATQDPGQLPNPAEYAQRLNIVNRIRQLIIAEPGRSVPKQPIGDLPWGGVGVATGQALSELTLDDRWSEREATSSRLSTQTLGTKKGEFSRSAELAKSVRRESLNVVVQESSRDYESAASAPPTRSSRSESVDRAVAGQSDVTARQRGNVFDISVVEGEIDPFQAAFLNSGELVFYRRVWRGGQRYVQGFVVEQHAFFDSLIKNRFEQSPFANELTLIVGVQGTVYSVMGATPVQQIRTSGELVRLSTSLDGWTPPKPQQDILVYRSTLGTPLGSLELLLTTPTINYGPGVTAMDLVLASLALVLFFGAIGLYKLGTAQIALAQRQNDFVSAVSHELKTPLTSIRMYGEMLRGGMVSDETKRRTYYDYIFFESERLSRLIGNVLQVAKLSRDPSRLELEEVTVGELLSLAKDKVSSAVEGAQFTLALETDADVGDARIAVNRDALTQIFINLVDNALKFSKAASRREIVVGSRRNSRSEDLIDLFVRDFGPGIDRKMEGRLFELFQRGESELTRTTPGTGLGLGLVRELAARMDASVRLNNMEPGVEFIITLKKQ